MHKRNISLIALAIAVPVTVVITSIGAVHRSEALGILYFPAILLSVLFSGITPAPGPVAVWSSSIVYTLVYLLIFVVLYALLLEFYLLRSATAKLHHAQSGAGIVPAAAESAGGVTPASQSTFEAIGKTIQELEARRRRHWVLDDAEFVDLDKPPALVGAAALLQPASSRPGRSVLRALHKNLVKRVGQAGADTAIRSLHDDAAQFVSNAPSEASAGAASSVSPRPS